MSSKDLNGAPAHYHKMNTTVFNRRTAEACATHLLPHLKPHFRILDLGCGPGSIALDLARLVPQGLVVGIDVSAESIEIARSAAIEQGVPNAKFSVGDAEDLTGFESESFDVVHAHQVLLHLSRPLHALREMRRLVKSGGGVVSTRDNAQRALVPPVPGVLKNLAAFDRLCQIRGADPDLGQRHHLLAHQAGFAWDHIEMSSWGWEMSGQPGREAWLRGVKNGSREVLLNAGISTEEETDEMAEGWEEWGRNAAGRLMFLDGALLCWK